MQRSHLKSCEIVDRDWFKIQLQDGRGTCLARAGQYPRTTESRPVGKVSAQVLADLFSCLETPPTGVPR